MHLHSLVLRLLLMTTLVFILLICSSCFPCTLVPCTAGSSGCRIITPQRDIPLVCGMVTWMAWTEHLPCTLVCYSCRQDGQIVAMSEMPQSSHVLSKDLPITCQQRDNQAKHPHLAQLDTVTLTVLSVFLHSMDSSQKLTNCQPNPDPAATSPPAKREGSFSYSWTSPPLPTTVNNRP